MTVSEFPVNYKLRVGTLHVGDQVLILGTNVVPEHCQEAGIDPQIFEIQLYIYLCFIILPPMTKKGQNNLGEADGLIHYYS